MVIVVGGAAIMWGAETFAEHSAAASRRLGVTSFALALLLAGTEPSCGRVGRPPARHHVARCPDLGIVAGLEENRAVVIASLGVWHSRSRFCIMIGTIRPEEQSAARHRVLKP
ncbi:MAG: hypothetical protein OEW42_13940 [Acidimicrobiia bacterium]|nr:hypothetical protein [Acidimicrobiia bacterium]